MQSPAPTAVSIGKRFLLVVGFGLCALLLGLMILASGIPWTLDFSIQTEGPDLFLPSVLTLVWWTGLINLTIVAFLWCTMPHWIGASDPDERSLDSDPDCAVSRRKVWASSLLAICLLAIIDSPRLSESLWNDELWSLGESVHGRWDRDLEGVEPADVLTEIRWLPIDWDHAIWRYDTTNHHFLLNILAKAGLSTWQTASGAEEWEFDETALRILPFMCALGALAAWAMLFRGLGFGAAAMILPWLLALHPWYQRHATGMRGYSLVFLFLPLTLMFALRAFRHGGWRAWMGFAVCQFLFMYSWPAGAAVMLAFNACLLIAIWRRWANTGRRTDQLKRLGIANLATLMILLPLVSPAIFQIGDYLQEEVVRSDMGLSWFTDLACSFFLGCGWSNIEGYMQRSGQHITGEGLWGAHPYLFAVVALLAVAFLLIGLGRWFRSRPGEASLFTLGLGSGPAIGYLRAISASGSDIFIFSWYLIFALPFVGGIVAIGIATLASKVPTAMPQARRIFLQGMVAVGLIAAYAFLASPRTLALRDSSADPRRESAEAIRGTLDLRDPANSKILTAHVFRSALVYDPRGWGIKTASNDGSPIGEKPGLTQLMRIADTRDLTLYVNVGFPPEAKEKYPDIMELLETPDVFELHSQHFGLEPQFERAVYLYRGGLFKFDFSRPKSGE